MAERADGSRSDLDPTSGHEVAIRAFGPLTLVVGGAALPAVPVDYGGAAYVFRRNAQGWTLAQQLSSTEDGPDAYFGSAAAISGDTLLLGAPGTHGTPPYGNPRLGAAYVVTAGLFDDGFE